MSCLLEMKVLVEEQRCGWCCWWLDLWFLVWGRVEGDEVGVMVVGVMVVGVWVEGGLE